jgi:K+-transporting ATPase ATPase A chain
MTVYAWIQFAAFFAVLLASVKPLGSYIARVYRGEPILLEKALAPVEHAVYRACGVRPDREMGWKEYAAAALTFGGVGLFATYALQRLQAVLPLNPQGFGGVPPDASINTAISYVTNTNWQGYAGETTMSYLTQMAGLTVQNFVSAATGMAVMVALARGIARFPSARAAGAPTLTPAGGSRPGLDVPAVPGLGNFWSDVIRGVLYVLLPLSILLALLLVSQGAVQTLNPYPASPLLQPVADSSGRTVSAQTIALGPAASQIAIKQLGTNGGGFFGANSAHPFENPTPLSNFLEMLSILLLPAALVYTFAKMAGDTRQGWAMLAAMFFLFVFLAGLAVWAEQGGNPALSAMGVDQSATNLQGGGNMEGKEERFGSAASAFWASATTAAANGSVDSMHDSFTPLGGFAPLFLIQLGEIVFGGVGSGTYGMLAFVIVAVFVAGLLVGRTPEYLGKKIESFEMKMASLILLIPVLAAKLGTALAVVLPVGVSSIFNPGAHGFSEVLYAFSSAAGNNGSAFAGLSADTPFYNTALGIVMFVSRYWLIIPVLAIAGSLAAKKKIPAGAGTLPTHTPLFVAWLIGVIVIVGALSFLPALSLGPLAEQLMIGH